jgi:RNA polymerase sigma factor (sigma-70 family)
MRNLSDFEIIESVLKGNQSDFALLVDRYKNRAFSLLKRMLKNEMDAEEVLQDCFIKSFNALSSFKKEAKFSTWFYRIVYNTAVTRISGKRRKTETEMTSIEDHFDLTSSYDFRQTEKINLQQFITEIIKKLPLNYATVLNMFYMDEMSCEEISEVMGISVSNVKVLLYRSRNAMRELIEKNDLREELL